MHFDELAKLSVRSYINLYGYV